MICVDSVAMDMSDSTSANTEVMTILHQQSKILETPWKAVRVAVTDPKIADVQVLTPEQILIQGLSMGTTDIIVWSEDEKKILQKKVEVVLDVDKIQATLERLFPTSDLALMQSHGDLIVSGHHRNARHAQQLQEFLAKTGISFMDMTDVAGVQQVQLQVRIAEVSKTGIKSLGANWFVGGSTFYGGVRTGSSSGGVSMPSLGAGPEGGSPVDSVAHVLSNEISIPGSITVFGGFPSADLAFFLEALAENQYLRLLANPTLVALNGKEASFLAGGEYPIPVVQSGLSNSITIEYREYGVRLSFRPEVLGDNTIRLHTRPEVSELTNVGAVLIGGQYVPALLTRKAETTIEMQSGQSFAMAGLLKQSEEAINSGVPGLKDLPVLGSLFRSVRYQQGETELVVLVTANLVEPLNIDPKTAAMPGLLHSKPNDWELYLEGRLEGKEPAKVDEVDAEWLKELGLDHLNGPGAWDAYGKEVPNSEASLAIEETEELAAAEESS
jgi:pilus assembly protein CpaC